MNEKKADRKAMIRLVTDQIQKKDPPFVAEAFEMLKEKGIGKAQAKEKIVDYCDALEDMQAGFPDLVLYYQQINDLLFEEGCEETKSSPDDSFSRLMDSLGRINEARADNHGVDALLEEWPSIKQYVEEHMVQKEADGTVKKPVYDPVAFSDDATAIICEVLDEVGEECINTDQPEKVAPLMKDIVDTFAFKDESIYLYDILEVFSRAGMYKERDDWYTVWHQRFPECHNIVNSYACSLMHQEPLDFDKTDAFLDEIAAHPEGWDEDSEYMLDKAADMYHERGMSDKEAEFRRLSKKKSRFRR